MNKELVLRLTAEANALEAQLKPIKQAMLDSSLSDDKYDELEKQEKVLNKQIIHLRKQALEVSR